VAAHAATTRALAHEMVWAEVRQRRARVLRQWDAVELLGYYRDDIRTLRSKILRGLRAPRLAACARCGLLVEEELQDACPWCEWRAADWHDDFPVRMRPGTLHIVESA
jgi:hypothetical protein